MSQGVTLDEIAQFVAQYDYNVLEMADMLRQQGYSEEDIQYLG
jgi:hypothetical protein